MINNIAKLASPSDRLGFRGVIEEKYTLMGQSVIRFYELDII